MVIELIWKGILAGLSVSVLVGPIGILIIQKTVNKGLLSGFISGIGASLSDVIYAAIAALSLGIIISFVDDHRLAFDFIATAILIILGIHIYRKNPVEDVKHHRQRSNSYISDLFSTFALTIPNPLVVFVMLAVFAKFNVSVERGNWLELSALILGVLIGANLWWLVLTNLVSAFRNKFNIRVLWWFNKIAGASVIIIAIVGLIFALVQFTAN